MPTSSKATQAANKVTVKRIANVAGIKDTLTLNGMEFETIVAVGSTLSSEAREEVFDLYEKNMRTLTEPSSLGFHPEDKRKELFHKQSRMILLYRDSDEGESTLVAFTKFRFELGYADEDSVYCYELQVADGYRGRGICRWFVDKLIVIGKHWKMEKVLLTVLKANTSAREVYRKLGFVVDTMSPEYEDSEEEEVAEEEKETFDYEILAKIL